jgi:hypothetical protein
MEGLFLLSFIDYGDLSTVRNNIDSLATIGVPIFSLNIIRTAHLLLDLQRR